LLGYLLGQNSHHVNVIGNYIIEDPKFIHAQAVLRRTHAAKSLDATTADLRGCGSQNPVHGIYDLPTIINSNSKKIIDRLRIKHYVVFQ